MRVGGALHAPATLRLCIEYDAGWATEPGLDVSEKRLVAYPLIEIEPRFLGRPFRSHCTD